MRRKTPKVVVTFASTSDAMAVEAAARRHGIPGRIIPVPSEVDAGCGLAWCVEPDERKWLLEGMRRFALPCEGVHDVLLY